MSATSITTRSRDSIYNRLLDSMFKEGNKHLLHRHFLLGKDWNPDRTRFLFQYLNLLSDFSCDVENYFNDKLKEALNIQTDTKISTDAIELQNAQYTMKIQKTDSVKRVEWFLTALGECEPEAQEHISNTIYVNNEDLLPYTGTLDEKITAYINSLGYDTGDVHTDIWVDYIGDSAKP